MIRAPGATAVRPPRLQRQVLRTSRSVLGWLALAVLLVGVGALVVIPRTMGWTPLTVLSGSMEPTIPTGSQVIVAPINGEKDAAHLEVGDVVAFMPYPDDDTLVTHRIISKTLTSDGLSFQTAGDATGAVDNWDVTATQLRGLYRYHVPYAGHLATALTPAQKHVGILTAVLGLIGYAAWQEIAAARDRRSGRA